MGRRKEGDGGDGFHNGFIFRVMYSLYVCLQNFVRIFLLDTHIRKKSNLTSLIMSPPIL